MSVVPLLFFSNQACFKPLVIHINLLSNLLLYVAACINVSLEITISGALHSIKI